jgi:outer membrane protein assembly factor BamB
MTLLAAVLVGGASPALAENWPCWRGPRGDGTSKEASAPIHWDGSSNFVWRTALPGFGHASPIVWGERIFTVAALTDTQERVLHCLDRKSGSILWQQTVLKAALEPKQGENSYASSTPATDGQKVYVAFQEDKQMAVAAYDFSGKQLWLVHPASFASPHGFSCSPVLFKDKLILDNDNRSDSCLLALSRADGKTLWKTEQENRTLGYSTPLIRELPGGTQMIHGGDKSIGGYDPETGARQWIIDGPSDEFVASPVYSERAGLIFVCSSYPARHVLAIKPGGRGNITATHIAWRTMEGAPYVSSPIIEGDYLLASANNGPLYCYEAATGKILWHEPMSRHHASPVSVNGLVYFLDDKGVMNIVRPGPQFVRVAQNELGEATYASPAVSDGQIFLRGAKHLFCIGPSSK